MYSPTLQRLDGMRPASVFPGPYSPWWTGYLLHPATPRHATPRHTPPRPAPRRPTLLRPAPPRPAFCVFPSQHQVSLRPSKCKRWMRHALRRCACALECASLWPESHWVCRSLAIVCKGVSCLAIKRRSMGHCVAAHVCVACPAASQALHTVTCPRM